MAQVTRRLLLAAVLAYPLWVAALTVELLARHVTWAPCIICT